VEHEDSISLNKFISSTGECSRREADKLIDQGRVLLNGLVARKGNRVGPGDEVIVDGSYLKKSKKQKVIIAYNKPLGVVCTTDRREANNIIDQIKYKERLFPIGRLDKPSQGLILLTNDGDIVNKILRAGNKHEKEYIVTTNKAITPSFIKKMAGGLPILGTTTKKCKVQQTGTHKFKIILVQGLNRQIRRMCEFLGYKVASLKRVRIMNLHLGNLQEGSWRRLTKQEEEDLRKLSSDSSKT